MRTIRNLSEEMIKTLSDQKKFVGTNEALTDICLLLEVALEMHKETCVRCGNPKNFHKETENKLGCGCFMDVMFG